MQGENVTNILFAIHYCLLLNQFRIFLHPSFFWDAEEIAILVSIFIWTDQVLFALVKDKENVSQINHWRNDRNESHLMFYLLIWSRNLFTVLDIEH